MTEHERLIVAGREVAVSNPGKVLIPQAGVTKLDLVRYYIAVADGALRGSGGRPNVLVRYPNGIAGEFFFQKRAPESRPPWVEVVSLSFPSGRTAEEVVPRDAATLAWMANLACLELHPHPVRAEDLDHPDELRVDLDPVPGVTWDDIRDGRARRAGDARRLRAGRLAEDVGLARHARLRPHRAGAGRSARCGAPRSRSRARWNGGRPAWRRASGGRKSATASSSTTTRTRRTGRSPAPTRSGRRRTRACRRRSRGTRSRRASRATSRSPRCRRGSPRSAIAMPASTTRAGSLEPLLELSARHEREGQGDAPWPPQYRKQPGEPPRVQPSRRRVPARPLVEIGRAAHKEDALAGLERWRVRHPEAAAHLRPADVLVDAMRGRFRTWTRIRVNLQHVPVEMRPAQEALDPDAAPNEWEGVSPDGAPRRRPSRARKAP